MLVFFVQTQKDLLKLLKCFIGHNFMSDKRDEFFRSRQELCTSKPKFTQSCRIILSDLFCQCLVFFLQVSYKECI